MTNDPRIPVTILAAGARLPEDLCTPGLALLTTAAERDLPAGLPMASFAPGAAGHRFGCACCAGRSAAAQALDRLFQDRARGACRWFDRVVAVLPGGEAQAELFAALREDRMVAARFRAAR